MKKNKEKKYNHITDYLPNLFTKVKENDFYAIGFYLNHSVGYIAD